MELNYKQFNYDSHSNNCKQYRAKYVLYARISKELRVHGYDQVMWTNL